MVRCTSRQRPTANSIRGRANVARVLWPIQLVVTGLSLIATMYVRPGVLENFLKWPVGFAIPAFVVGSLVYLFIAERGGKDKGAFLASCGYIVGMLVGAAFALYPTVLPASTDPSYSLTIENTATGAHGMLVGFVWWGIGMVLAAFYFVFVYRMFRGKVRIEEGDDRPRLLTLLYLKQRLRVSPEPFSLSLLREVSRSAGTARD